MGLGPWSFVAMLSALTGALDYPQPASLPNTPAADSPAEAAANFEFASLASEPLEARAFAASFDSADISRVGSTKVQERCIRASMDADAADDPLESIGWRPVARPFRKALDDADLSAPPDPPRYLRLTLDD